MNDEASKWAKARSAFRPGKESPGGSEAICDGRVGPSCGCIRTHPEDILPVIKLNFFGSGGRVKSREELMKLPLRDERGGGRKEKRHVPHHLFDQRLYSTIHSYLATLANYNLQSPLS